MSSSLNAALFVICTGHLVTTASARAGVIYVDSSATGPTQDGSSWCTAIIRLQDAIAIAQSGDEIRVAGGTFRPDQGVAQNPGDRTATFAVKNGVVLTGGYGGCNATNPNVRNWLLYETVLSGDLAENDGPDYANNAENSYHVVSYSDPSAVGSVLDGFTVCGGNADGSGPAELTTNQGSGINIRNGTERCMPGGPELRNCTIRDNWSLHHGAVNDHAFTTFIDNCTIRDNYSGEEGAGLLIHTGSATVRNSIFLNNHCDGTGGGVWTGDDQTPQCNPPVSSPSFSNCVFEGNSAVKGGGFYADSGSNPTFSGCAFEGNSATDKGGGLYTFAHVILNITDALFEDNYAANEGGGLYAYTKGGVLQGLTVRNNRAGQNGGGAEISTAAGGLCGGTCPVTSWKDSLFENNEALVGGGIHSHYRTVHDFENVEFRDNRSTSWAGGGFYLTGELTTVNMTDCSFVGNTSVSVGGGMYIFHMANVKLVKTDFTSNRAMSSGAGLEVFSDSTVHVINSCFLGNELNIGSSSIRNGGALNVGSSDVFVVNSVFAGNQAIQGAAAATGIDGYLQLVNCTIGYNVASRAGGGIYVGQGTVDVRNSILWGNASDPQYEEQIHVFQGAAAVELNVVQDGWPGNNNMDVDPLFVDFAGPDGAPGTIDDDFRLRLNSQAVNVGDAAFLPLDIADLDNDADTSEGIPLDLAGQPRILGAALDLGAYERLFTCQAGFFSATGQEPCSACPAGEHQPNVQATNCLPCSPGTFSAATASANCSPCSSGSFQPSEGQTSCAACSCNDGQSCTLDSCDAVFGECQHQMVCSVPAVSAWGALILVLMIGVAATLVLGSRRYESETI